ETHGSLPRACLLTLGSVSQDDETEDDAAEAGHCVLVVAGGQSAPLLAPVEGSLDGVAFLVRGGVEAWRSPTLGTFGLAVGDLVVAFGDGVLYSPLSQERSCARMRVRLVRQEPKPQVVSGFDEGLDQRG